MRVFLVGTDTNAGKTAFTCAALLHARRAGVRVLPFKPAQSGDPGPTSDARRLLDAADPEMNLGVPDICPLRYRQPLAPGIADDPSPFLGRGASASDPEAAKGRARWALARLETKHDPEVILIEGAGGLHVPMPGGSWQPEWISAFDARPLVVARAGLGTINHTLATFEGLRVRELEPLGFVTVQLRGHDDPSRPTNVRVIEQASGVPCLGHLPFLGRPVPPIDDPAWERLSLVDDFWPRLGAA